MSSAATKAPDGRDGAHEVSLRRRVAGQGLLLFAGFGIAQACSFARNALLGHLLSKGDFGIAATITLTLQLLETATDVAADRFVIQASAASERQLLGVAHAVQLLRAFVVAALMWLAAPFAASFFHMPEAAWGFHAAAIALLVKGFTHLESKRLQKELDNRAAMALEVAPQASTLLLAWPAVLVWPGYAAIVWLTVVQAILGVVISQAIARHRWSLAWDRQLLRQLASFSWPIWLSAIPLMAIFQGDRLIIGHYFGAEVLAGYTAAFMVTMVPGLIASRVSFSLILPMLSQVKEREQEKSFVSRYALLLESTAVMTGLYAGFFLVFGGDLVALTFGAKYQGLHAITGALAIMWSARMLQAVPGTALMALGRTDIFPIAGAIRATALVPAFLLALNGGSLAQVAGVGALGEIASFIYVLITLSWSRQGTATPALHGVGILLIAIAMALLLDATSPDDIGLGMMLGRDVLGMACALLACLPLVPELRRTALNFLDARGYLRLSRRDDEVSAPAGPA